MYGRTRYRIRYFLLGCTLLAPFTAQPATITINGTCEVGCPSTPALSDGTSVSSPFNFSFTFGNGDSYDISGTYAASYSITAGSTISVDPVVTYTGSAPSAGTDTINFSLLQDYFDAACCTWAGDYTESVPLTLSSLAGPGSTVSGELLYDGQSVGLVGPFGPGSYSVTKTTTLDFGALNNADTLSAAFNFQFVFGAGTLPDASAASTTPEPAGLILSGIGLLSLIGLRRQIRSRIAS